eukprot:c29939_g1_i1 orf=2-364(-)
MDGTGTTSTHHALELFESSDSAINLSDSVREGQGRCSIIHRVIGDRQCGHGLLHKEQGIAAGIRRRRGYQLAYKKMQSLVCVQRNPSKEEAISLSQTALSTSLIRSILACLRYMCDSNKHF